MTDRFQKSRWSGTRLAMEAMKPGELIILPMSQYYNALSSANRMSDAYGDRHYRTSRAGGQVRVWRLS